MENQLVKNSLHGVRSNRIPRWFMRQAGRHLPEYRKTRSKFERFTDFLFATPDIVDVTLQPLNRYDLDAAIIFSDILVVPMLLGTQVEFLEGSGPKLSVISQAEEVDRLDTYKSLDLCNPIYEALHQVRSRLDKNKTLIGFAGAPWTIASYMIEGKTSKTFTECKAFAYRNPEAFQKLLNIISHMTANHLIKQIEAGADVVKLFDSWAGAVPYHKRYDWIIAPQLSIIEKVASVYPDVKFIIFAKGAEGYYAQYPQHPIIGAFALGPSSDLEGLCMELPENLAVQGALDPSLLVVGGDEMVKEIEIQCETFSKRPYIFNLGHGILPETPIENVQLVLQTLDRLAA